MPETREWLWIAKVGIKDVLARIRKFKRGTMIRFQTVQPHDRDLLWNINQKYRYEMTMFYPDEMDEAGNLHYGQKIDTPSPSHLLHII